MTSTKLDFPAAPRRVARNPNPHLDPNTKLDLPGTLKDFANLSGSDVVDPKPFRDRVSGQALANAAGLATINFGAPPIGWDWLIERLVVVGTGTGAFVYVNAVQVMNEADFSPTPAGDVADETSPIFVPSGQPLLVQFQGCALNDICTVNAQIIIVPSGTFVR